MRQALSQEFGNARCAPVLEGISGQHRYPETNGVQILVTLRILAINALRLDWIWSITEGIAALAHDIKGLLHLLGWREPTAASPSGDFR